MAGTKTPKERAAEFLAGAIATLPEELRPHAEALAKHDGFLETVGNGVKRQDEFSRSMDESRRLMEENNAKIEAYNQWYEDQKPLVDRATAILAKQTNTGGTGDDSLLDPGGDSAMPAIDAKKLTEDITAQLRKEIQEKVWESEKGAVPFFALVNDLAIQHLQTFGEQLDTRKLLADPNIYKIGVEATYRQTYQEKFDAKAKAEFDGKIEAAKKEATEAANAAWQAKVSSQPFVTPGMAERSPFGQALDAAKVQPAQPGADGKPGFHPINRVDERAAAADYARLVAAGVGTT